MKLLWNNKTRFCLDHNFDVPIKNSRVYTCLVISLFIKTQKQNYVQSNLFVFTDIFGGILQRICVNNLRRLRASTGGPKYRVQYSSACYCKPISNDSVVVGTVQKIIWLQMLLEVFVETPFPVILVNIQRSIVLTSNVRTTVFVKNVNSRQAIIQFLISNWSIVRVLMHNIEWCILPGAFV